MSDHGMKAAYIERYGRDVLTVGNRPIPEVGAGEILVRVAAASVNPRDWLLMRGIYQGRHFAKPFPITLGSDFSGTVEEIGPGVTTVSIGDAVFGMQAARDKFGAYSEFIKIKASAVVRKPDGISHHDAAAMPCAGLTSHQALHDITHVQPGETVLINGASGGVGIYAIQIAKLAGAHVVAVCGPDNGNLCRTLGADQVINYRAENFYEQTNAFDVVYDVIGRSSMRQSAKALKAGGRYITTIPNLTTLRQAGVSKLVAGIASATRKSTHLVMVKPYADQLSQMANWIADGKMKSVIDSVYPLEDAAGALKRSQSWRARGKIIIDVASQ